MPFLNLRSIAKAATEWPVNDVRKYHDRVMKRIVLAARPKGVPTAENFRLEVIPMPTPGPGQCLAKTIWLSLDPYMRGRMNDAKSYAKPNEVGETMEAECVAEIMASNHEGYAVCEIVVGPIGWADCGISDGTGMRKVDPSIAPISTAVGILGMPDSRRGSG